VFLTATPGQREEIERVEDQSSRTRELSERFCFSIS
jgi:hypothetical protein